MSATKDFNKVPLSLRLRTIAWNCLLDRERSTWSQRGTAVAALSGIPGSLGYFIAFLLAIYPLGTTEFTDVLTTVLLLVGPPIGVGVKLGVVTFAGIAVRRLQSSPVPQSAGFEAG